MKQLYSRYHTPLSWFSRYSRRLITSGTDWHIVGTRTYHESTTIKQALTQLSDDGDMYASDDPGWREWLALPETSPVIFGVTEYQFTEVPANAIQNINL